MNLFDADTVEAFEEAESLAADERADRVAGFEQPPAGLTLRRLLDRHGLR